MAQPQTYYATIRHHTLASAPQIEIKGTLRAAKTAATQRFGDGFQDHAIVIWTVEDDSQFRDVASRLIRDRKWSDYA